MRHEHWRSALPCAVAASVSASATGAIGYEDVGEQFFKFGPYRDPVDYPTTVYFDNFRRGASFAEVDPAG